MAFMTTSRNILQILVLIGDTDAVKKKKKRYFMYLKIVNRKQHHSHLT